LSQPTEPDDDSAPLNLASVATIDYSSEDPAHPVEHLLDEHTGPGGSYWAAAQADTTEQLVLAFDQPQSVTRLVYEVEETEHERTQEVHVEASTDTPTTGRGRDGQRPACSASVSSASSGGPARYHARQLAQAGSQRLWPASCW